MKSFVRACSHFLVVGFFFLLQNVLSVSKDNVANNILIFFLTFNNTTLVKHHLVSQLFQADSVTHHELDTEQEGKANTTCLGVLLFHAAGTKGATRDNPQGTHLGSC